MNRPSPEPRTFTAGAGSAPRTCEFCGARFLGDHSCKENPRLVVPPSPTAPTPPASVMRLDAPPPGLGKMPIATALGALHKLQKEGRTDELEILFRRFVADLPSRASSLGPTPAAEVLRGLSKLPMTPAHATPIVDSLLPRVAPGAKTLTPAILIAVCQSLEVFIPHVHKDALRSVRASLPPVLDRMTESIVSVKVFGIVAVLRAAVLCGPLADGDEELRGALYRFCRSAIPLVRKLVLDVEPEDVAIVLRAIALIGIDAAIAARMGTLLDSVLPRCTKSSQDAGEILGLLGRLPLTREMLPPVTAFASDVAHHLPKDLSPELTAGVIMTLGRLPLEERPRASAIAWSQKMSRHALSRLHTYRRHELADLKAGLATLGALDKLSDDVLELAIARHVTSSR